MRIAVLGVSHWHAPLYYRPAARLPGVRIVGVSDPDPGVVTRVGRELETKAFTDPRELLAAVRPEFVFIFGRHCDMAETAGMVVDAGIPFLLEKPGGMNRAQVAAIRDRAAEKGVHAGTGFNFRVSDLYKEILAVVGEDRVAHASFRYIAGGPSRYRETGCAWMLDPTLSGGGSTINLSIHFVDMFRAIVREAPREVTALLSHATWELPIEDYSAVLLRSAGAACVIETGYTYPARLGVFDQHFSIRTPHHYIVVRSDDAMEIHRACDARVETLSTPVSNAAWYPVFVAECLDRARDGRPPVAGLGDLVAAMEVVDAAYASHQAGGARIALDGARS